MFLRKQLRDRYLKQIDKIDPLSTEDLAASAVFFAPHQDDETLGCGGTIMRKRALGAEVKIVFMTDGSRSHDRFIPDAELITLRQQEAVKAAETLGVASENVVFLAFRDGELQQSSAKAIAQVNKLLQQKQPQQVFIPYIRETHPDHLATNQIVLAALQNYTKEVTVYEYPVWYWHHFPWTKTGDQDSKIAYFKASIKAKCGLQLVQEFNYRVEIEPVKSQKQLALAQHQTQMKPLVNDPNWGLLKDVSDGEWLECFFQTQEIFRRTIVAGAKL
ncbi:MAG TPA: PIG-L family deacetylase [Coleofasciculaceae cyanobacterium]|jgi:LmbE family N-acetylglucosaminyl deacetylase